VRLLVLRGERFPFERDTEGGISSPSEVFRAAPYWAVVEAVALEEVFQAEVFVGVEVGDRGAEVLVRIADVTSGRIVAIDVMMRYCVRILSPQTE
jgi:hypothetical protein